MPRGHAEFPCGPQRNNRIADAVAHPTSVQHIGKVLFQNRLQHLPSFQLQINARPIDFKFVLNAIIFRFERIIEKQILFCFEYDRIGRPCRRRREQKGENQQASDLEQ